MYAYPPVSDRNRGAFFCLSEIDGCVRYTSTESWRNVWNGAENPITFASSNNKSDPDRQRVSNIKKDIII